MRSVVKCRGETEMWRKTTLQVLVLLMIVSTSVRVSAQNEDKKWSDVAEFSYVVAAGNARSATLGFSNKATWEWEKTLLELKLGAIRAESTVYTRRVTSAGPPPVVVRDSDTRLTAENFYLGFQLNRNISNRFFGSISAGWKRNRFSGVENQYSGAAGIGTTWLDKPDHEFRTDYAVTYTSQEDVVPGPEGTRTFAGARLTWSYKKQLTGNTAFGNDLVVDENLKDTEDFRADMINSLQVAMSKNLALKVSLKWLFDNQPSLVTAGDPDGYLAPGETAQVILEKLDTIFTVSLVVNF